MKLLTKIKEFFKNDFCIVCIIVPILYNSIVITLCLVFAPVVATPLSAFCFGVALVIILNINNIIFDKTRIHKLK